MRELTVVAMVRSDDCAIIDQLAATFPPSNHAQLPPHVTVISEIFTEDDDVAGAVATIEKYVREHSIVNVTTRGIQVWPFQKYGGHVVSLEVVPNKQLSDLRYVIHDSLSTPELPEYNPHITLQLSVDPNAVAVELDTNIAIDAHLDEIRVLARGGDFFGWEVLSTKQSSI